MKSKIEDLTDHLFSSLDRLNNENLSDEELQREVTRAKAVSDIAGRVIETAKISLDAVKVQADYLGNQAALPHIFQSKQISKNT